MRTGVLAAVFIVLGFASLGAEIHPDTFSCTGEITDGLCQLSDARMYATATWRFSGIVGGEWTLVLEGLAADPCDSCAYRRDLVVQVFWREAADGSWNWTYLPLVSQDLEGDPAGYPVRGELPLKLLGPELWVAVRRAVLCDPWPSFSWTSAYLIAPPVEFPTPPPPIPVPPPVEPPPPVVPPPPEEVCDVGMAFSCAPPELAQECAGEVDLTAVARLPLPETYGPGDAQRLSPGHYSGEFGENDYQDWYRVRTEFDQAMVVYLKVLDPGLVVDVHLVHDPCGTELAVCRDVEDTAALVIPCYHGYQCETIPSAGEGPCWRSGACNVFIRIARKSGAGRYLLSIIPASLIWP